jgi:hypothetical protein
LAPSIAHNCEVLRVVLLVLIALPVFAGVEFDMFLSARGVNATGPQSWLDGGFGRFGAGGDESKLSAAAQAGITWTLTEQLEAHVSGYGSDDGGGIAEAYVNLHGGDVQLRFGQFFLPTSRENKAALWTSPYSMTFSAVNSWIAEEVRPVGVDLQWRHTTGAGHVVSAAGTAFRGNDSMGALLAWRGWALHNRLSVYDEVLPLPPIPTLQTFFANQRDDGTKPFGTDLDGNTGFAARARWSLPERATVHVAHVDNNGDRLLHRGEYAWETSFDLVGVEIGNTDRFVAAAEFMTGRTGMGVSSGPAFVEAGFHAGYLLVSQKTGRNRFTARFDRFGTSEKDFSPAESNEERGHAWLFAWLFDVTRSLRAGVEIVHVTGKRELAFDGRTATVELRYGY